MKKPRLARKPGPRSFELIERRLPHSRMVDFPRVKGRTVEKIQFFSTDGVHSITILFQDKTALNLNIVPGFRMDARLENFEGDAVRVVKRWKPLAASY